MPRCHGFAGVGEWRLGCSSNAPTPEGSAGLLLMSPRRQGHSTSPTGRVKVGPCPRFVLSDSSRAS